MGNTIFPIIFNAFAGFGYGHDLVGDVVAAKTYLKGENYYFPVMHQFGLVSSICYLAQKIFETYRGEEASFRIKLLSNVVPLATLPIFSLVAALRHDQYDWIKEQWNHVVPSPLKLPEKMNGQARAVVDFISEHTTEVVRVASIIGLIALIPLGQPVYSAFGFLALWYDYAARKGAISLENRLRAETYFPAISLVGNLLEGTVLSRFQTLCLEPVGFAQDLTLSLQNRVDALFRKVFFLKGHSLSECDAPHIRPPEVTFSLMNKILNAKDNAFVLNPTHLTKEVSELYSLQTSKNYPELLTLFDKVSWVNEYDLVLGILCDDDQFLAFLKNQFPEENADHFHQKVYPEDVEITAAQRLQDRKDLKSRIDAFIGQLAQAKGITSQQYAADRFKGLMEGFVRVLTGQDHREGDQHDIETARSHVQVILPILSSLDPSLPVDNTELKDQYEYVLHQLQNNALFQNSLKLLHPGVEADELIEQTDFYLTALAKDADLSKQEYAADIFLIYKMDQNRKSFEDCLLNLAACGGYCTEELQRETKSLKDAILAEKAIDSGKSFEETKIESFELRLLQALQRLRHHSIQVKSEILTESFLFRWLPTVMKKNMHVERDIERFLSLGFYPISNHERSEISIVEFLAMEFILNFIIGNPLLEKLFGSFFKDFHANYRENLEEALKDILRIDYNDYMTYIIRKEGLFTESEQDEITDLFTIPGQAEKMLKGFYHLTLYRLGVLKFADAPR